jgi:hypothetical protein
MMTRSFATVVVLASLASVCVGAEWHVTPNGKPDNSGAADSPWSLAFALSAKGPTKPGDTIWVHAGKYPGRTSCFLHGAEGNPIRVRCWKRDRVTLGQLDTNYYEISDTSYVWFEGMEVTSRGQGQDFMDVTMSNSGDKSPFNTGIKVINMILHDGQMGVQTEGHGVGDEINGCIIYYNGYDAPDRGHGHGLYVQSIKGPRLIKDNIVFRNFCNGTQLYGSGACGGLNNVSYVGNTWFNNGEISYHGMDWNLSIGSFAGVRPQNAQLIENYSYAPSFARVEYNALDNCDNPIIKDNYIMAPSPEKNCAMKLSKSKDVTMTGNTLCGPLLDFKATDYPDNHYLTARPTEGKKVFVRKNDYEEGRANITIFNWDKSEKVEVDISKVRLKNGDKYEVRDVQDWYGKPVVLGTYDGKPISVPMTGLTVAAPIGLDATKYKTPPHTAPEFGVFVVMKALSDE